MQAQPAIPGSRIPLTLDNYQFKTTTLIFPLDWKPTHIRWLLQNPYGETVYFVESTIDQVSIIRQGYEGLYHYTIWGITENTGYIQIPAFAEPGNWKLKATFYDKLFGFDFRKDTDTLYQIPVTTGTIFDNLNAPIYFIIDLPLIPANAIQINLGLLVSIVLLFVFLAIMIATIKKLKPSKSGNYEKRK